jgi:hypothetical protein
MEFPVLKNKPVWPSKTALPMAQEEQSDGAKFNGDLAGGALQVVDWKKKSATMADECIGFLDLVWHAAR